ncbi:hypothetical protein CO657_33110 (plasmid) [Rhizobium acidisoli]|uniref:Uncharacterized protein n=1 Tax=Rhizobium acidisoli TaxID=1538158 RepID=A0AAE6C4P0_9HYPH|nr:hypothetical protein [Rhizobium acidisoli]KPH06716.1 hypothetical protein AOG23_21735 [Rhizobium acidisoli]QAS82648.1 hypothetical protein CO657_33110 [Rhizobium acidisoli]
MSRKFQIIWWILALAVLLGQIHKVHATYFSPSPLSMAEWFDWLMSFPECVVVCLFAARIQVGSVFWWRTYSFIYPIYALLVVCVCVRLYLFRYIPDGHPIPYGIALAMVILMKVMSFQAIWQYARDNKMCRYATA